MILDSFSSFLDLGEALLSKSRIRVSTGWSKTAWLTSTWAELSACTLCCFCIDSYFDAYAVALARDFDSELSILGVNALL